MADRLHNDKRTVRCFPLLRPSFFLFFFCPFSRFLLSLLAHPLLLNTLPIFPSLLLAVFAFLLTGSFAASLSSSFFFFFFLFPPPPPLPTLFFFFPSPPRPPSLPVYLFTPFPGILPAQYPPSAPPCSSQALKESQPVVGMMYPSNSDIPPIQRQDETN